MANNQNALPFDLDSPMMMKQRKRENNLLNWKWDAVIVIEDSDDEVVLFDSEGNKDNNDGTIPTAAIVGDEVVHEGPNEEQNATPPVNGNADDETDRDEILADDVPKLGLKRKNIPRVKITGKRRLYQVFDEDESEKNEDKEDEHTEDDEWF
ncbi:hypothetical protein CTI12_AA605540 [Artemisia annua]|uniref:Uncharacterized protein n=1 Tax=Artemisia annua TaxID=35608 RepID=A0A2U1KGF0_ARTAN|nr:hypothetical protein CTI12_AA605540 [Artemisia annua]